MALLPAAIHLAQSFFFRVSTKRNNNSYVNYLLRVSGSIETFLKPCNFFVVVARTRSAKWTLAKGDR